MTRAAIVAIEPGEEPMLLRAQLEALGLDVHLNRIGKPSDLVSAFSFYGQPVELAIVAGHGDEKGFVFPEMAPDVDAMKLAEDRIRPSDVGSFPIRARVVISTACATGTDAFAAAFQQSGATYVAPEGDADAAAALMVVSALVYGVFRRKQPWAQALDGANALVDREDRFRLWPA